MRQLVSPRRLALAAVAAVLCLPVASASAAEQLVGLTADNQLLLFRSDSPSNLQGSVTVTGLATGETLLGIGYQDALGRIYALGSTNRLYVVNPITGAALPVSTLPFSPPLNGDAFAFAVDNTTNLAPRVLEHRSERDRLDRHRPERRLQLRPTAMTRPTPVRAAPRSCRRWPTRSRRRVARAPRACTRSTPPARRWSPRPRRPRCCARSAISA